MPMQPARVTRRQLLATATTAVPAFGVPRFVSARSLGGRKRPAPSDRIRVGVIGLGVRGKYLIANLPPEAEVVALCDCHLGRVESARRPVGEFREPLRAFSEGPAARCSVHQDYRVMLERTDFDAVIIATPDHHHALPAILACHAGLDVYIEKPLALTIAEGRAIVDAAKQFDRVVQVGSQQRTMEVNRAACEFIKRGGLGRVTDVRIRNFPGPMQIESVTPQPVDSELNWDLFCGPAPMRPHSELLWRKDEFKVGSLLWRGWDLWSDYSGHLTTNWGGHSLDMVQYALGKDDTGPVDVWLEGADPGPLITEPWSDKTPPLSTMKDVLRDWLRFCPVGMRYADGTALTFDPNTKKELFIGEKGTLAISRNFYQTDPPGLLPDPDPAEQAKWDGAGHVARPHLQNWLDCIRTRSQPNAPVEVGHRSATVCHLANLVRRLNRPLQWDPVSETFPDDPEANAELSRLRRPGFELP